MEKLSIDGLKNVEFFDCTKLPGWGSSRLKSFLENQALTPHSNPIIGIFDRDEEKILAEIEKDGLLFKSYGNNVYAFCIPNLIL